MTTHLSMATPRQPFAALDSPRLQHLTSIKNRQNGINSSPLAGGKSSISNTNKSPMLNSSTKRRHPTSIYEDNDGENVDPAIFLSPTKKSKCNDSTPLKPAFTLATAPAFTFSKASSASSMPPPSVPAALTPLSKANTSSPRAPLTAPAGRSPKAKRILPAVKPRRVSAPFTRIDPPSFLGNKTVPFSLDAALSGTLNRPSVKPAPAPTVEEIMPRNWFFDIYEDTPEEEASNLMEHSTLCLDLSSDEENSKTIREDRGKENTPPAGYETPVQTTAGTATSQSQGKKTRKQQQTRRKILKHDEMDDGQRSPLSDLETEDFFAEGLTKDSSVIVDAVPEKTAGAPTYTASSLSRELGKDCYVAPEHKVERLGGDVLDVPVVDGKGEVAGDIVIFEDSGDENVAPVSPVLEAKAVGEKRKRVEV